MVSKIETISTVKILKSPELYKVVDACNQTLIEEDLMFDLSLDEKDNPKMAFTIYST